MGVCEIVGCVVSRWRTPCLRPGVLNVVTAVESEDGCLESSVTPVPVLPKDAALEMRHIFDETVRRDLKSEKLLSPDRPLSDAQKSAIRQAIWRNHIRSFAVDLDFLLNDMDEGEADCQSDEKMDEARLNVFRSLLQFLESWNAPATIQYLIQACKEHGVISFYSKYTIDNDNGTSTTALYETAPRFRNDASGSGECSESDENNNNDPETAEFLQNFRDGQNKEEAAYSHAQRLLEFPNLEEFASAGCFGDYVTEPPPPGDPLSLQPVSQSPSSEGPSPVVMPFAMPDSRISSSGCVSVAQNSRHLKWVGALSALGFMVYIAFCVLHVARVCDPTSGSAIVGVSIIGGVYTGTRKPVNFSLSNMLSISVIFCVVLFLIGLSFWLFPQVRCLVQ